MIEEYGDLPSDEETVEIVKEKDTGIGCNICYWLICLVLLLAIIPYIALRDFIKLTRCYGLC